ncbi:methylated-DNA--[protein]-cysteine S-methyltransferase [Seonamhaeicola sp.]|uniref:methylated-DNA--[protein]-cysteine S-methyltransferase n=1 Tax=Seonamhaeicola sp. TaxID=1912245 RepID=UPI00262FF154|nr:methylated-DNA--[protein]-cysteine S-methyltransferase [Seonamhaeicola sp.]
MKVEKSYHYSKIEEAIEFLDTNFKEQPSLDDVANHVHLSPFHFQKLFKEWVGISPKKYLQYLSSNFAKGLLYNKQNSLFNTAYETGLSGTSRLHDLFINIEGMTPAEYKNGGKKLTIKYSFAESPFGNLIVASTSKGICYMAFVEDKENGFLDLKKEFPNAQYEQVLDKVQQDALFIFQNDWSKLSEIKLHLKGSDFQLKVWEALLQIPQGDLSTYGEIAEQIKNPKASRAVGTAIGKNPIAFLIPCHRVIQTSGHFGGYRWNPIRKKAIIGWEMAKMSQF